METHPVAGSSHRHLQKITKLETQVRGLLARLAVPAALFGILVDSLAAALGVRVEQVEASQDHIGCHAPVRECESKTLLASREGNHSQGSSFVCLLPLDAEEKARVQKAGGQVVKWMNSVDRVFVPGKHEPGLAVARAFGDFDLKSHGLIVNPVVRVHDIKPSDEFAVLCSDGVSPPVLCLSSAYDDSQARCVAQLFHALVCMEAFMCVPCVVLLESVAFEGA